MSLLKDRVKGKVKFVFFCDRKLWYECEDSYIFPVPVEDTVNTQGDQPKFLHEDKGIAFMRWIRKSMKADDELQH